MSGMLRWAVVFITSALVCYTVAVWSERLAGRLKGWHLLFFWLGLAADVVGTGQMFRIAGGLSVSFHGVTGVLAIALMAVHTAWATVVLARRDEHAIRNFHKFSVVVWVLWLVPFVSGAILGGRM